jgi:ankyrin repeat protein
VVQELLKQGAEVDLRDSTQRTALMFASTGPDVATVEAILKAGADVNATDSHENWTPLMFAAAEGHRAVVEKLLDYGARTDLRDTDGDGALEFATSNRHPEVVELLRARSNPGGNAKPAP